MEKQLIDDKFVSAFNHVRDQLSTSILSTVSLSDKESEEISKEKSSAELMAMMVKIMKDSNAASNVIGETKVVSANMLRDKI